MTTTGGTHVFTYGTLMFADVVEALLGRRFESRPARLPDFARLCVRGRVYPGIVARAGATTDGVLYEGLDGAALARLDEFEGELYERRTVVVLASSSIGTATDDQQRAEVYVVASGKEHLLAEEPWDAEQFRAQHHQRYVAHCRALHTARGDASGFEP